MGRVWSFIYGGVLLVLSIASFFPETVGFFLPNALLPWLILGMGVLILFTRLDAGPTARDCMGRAVAANRSGFRWIRRFVFGTVLVLMGVFDIWFSIASVPGLEDVFSQFAAGTTGSGIVLLLFSVVYFLSAFHKTRNVVVSSW